VKTAPVKLRKKKRSHKEEQEYRGMETAILDAEEEVARLEAESADPLMSTDHIRATETFKALSVAQERVKTLYTRWAELEQ